MLEVVYTGYSNDDFKNRIYLNDIVKIKGGIINGQYAKGKVKFIGKIRKEIYYGIDISKGMRKTNKNSCNGCYNNIQYFQTKNNKLTARFITISDIISNVKSKTSLKYTISDMIEYKNVIAKIRFIGTPLKTLLYGIELNISIGKHDGTHKSSKIRYFKCKHNYGIYVNVKKNKNKNLICNPNQYYKQLNILQQTKWISQQRHLRNILIYGFIRIDNNINSILNISSDIIILLIIKYFAELSLITNKFISKNNDIGSRCCLGELYQLPAVDEYEHKLHEFTMYLNDLLRNNGNYKFKQCFICNNSDKIEFKMMGIYQPLFALSGSRYLQLYAPLYYCFKCKYYITKIFKTLSLSQPNCTISPWHKSGYKFTPNQLKNDIKKESKTKCTQCNGEMVVISFKVNYCNQCHLYEKY